MQNIVIIGKEDISVAVEINGTMKRFNFPKAKHFNGDPHIWIAVNGKDIMQLPTQNTIVMLVDAHTYEVK